MSAIRFLAADKLASWLAEVAASRQVLAPRQEGKAVVFRPLVAGETPSLARATISPKAAVFPGLVKRSCISQAPRTRKIRPN